MKKHEPFHIYQCNRCKKLELPREYTGIVGQCKAKDLPVKVVARYTLENPGPDCKKWAKGKPKLAKKEKK